MATTQNTYTGDNSTTLFSFTFPYLEESDVKVSLDGVVKTQTTDYTFANATQISFNTAPGSGVAIRIYRDTNNDALAATFFAGSAIRAQDLNDDFLQNAYVTQEVKNRYLDKSTGGTITGDVTITGDFDVTGDTDLTGAFDVTGASSFTGNVGITGTLDMNANRILDVGTPTAGTDATNKTYVDTQDALKVAKAGDTMTGNLAMSNNRVTGLGTPSATTDAANKAYVDANILTGYQGPQASDPTTRTGGGALEEGDLYFDTTQNVLKAYTGSEWVVSAAAGQIVRWRKTAAGGETSLSGNDDGGSSLSYVVGNEQVFLNGVLQQRGVDYTASTGTSITGLTALTAGDIVELHAVQGYTSGTVTDGSITSAKIANDTIVNADVNSSAGIVATKLSFTQSGTGATARTVDSKLKDVVSVKDFGAVGDGVTDDTAAIQAAIQAANKVILPAGQTFTITSNITVPSNKHVVVEGILTRTGSGAANAFLLNGNNIRIDGSGEIRGPQYGLTISYESNQSAIFNTPDLTLATQLKNITIANLTISGWGDAGVEMWDVDGLSCSKLTLHDIGRIGLQALTGKNITYSDNYIYDIGPGGGGVAPFLNAYGMSVSSDTSIVVPRPTNVKMCNNTVIGIEHWEAYDLHGVDGAIIQNNTAIDCMIGIFVGPSTGGNNQNCDNVVVDGNYLNNLGSTYSRAGIIVAPGYTTSQYGDNIVVSDNAIVGHGTNQATYDAGYVSTDGEGSVYIVRTRNCVVNSNVITSPYQIGIHSRAQNLGTTISNNRVDSPVTANSEAVCFKGNDSDACIVSVTGNTWQRLGGSSSAVTITGTPSSTYGYRYSESNEHIGSFVSVFTGSSYNLLHSSSSYLTKLLCVGRVSLTGSGATLISGFNVTSVTRQAQGVVRVVIDTDGLDANYYLSVTPQSGSFASATYNSPAAGQFDIILWNSTTTLVDTPFSFEVRGSAV